MNTRDQWVVGGGIATAILAGLWIQVIVGPNIASGTYDTGVTVAILDDMIDFFTIIATVAAAGMVYKARDTLGGTMGRGLEVIGVGLVLYVLTYWPSYRWSIEGSPAWLGMSSGFWDVLFSSMTLATFGFIAYGFYLIWSLGRR